MPISIKQDMVDGEARATLEKVQSLFLSEGGDSTDLYECRRVGLGETTPHQTDHAMVSSDIRCGEVASVPDHLSELLSNTTQGMTKEESAAIADILIEFQDVFSANSTDLGLTHLGEHTIDTGDTRPLTQPPRRTPLAFEGEDKAAIEKLQQQGSIQPSTSPWASPIVLVRKKDGSVRPCVDYRRLNAVTKPDAFPLPRTEDCLDAMAESRLFSTLDITSAYNLVPVRKEDIPKTVFVTKFGLFEFTTMPFGLSNAPATFQRVIELALSVSFCNPKLVFLDM